MRRNAKKFLIGLVLLSVLFSLTAQTRVTDYLSVVREQMVFPEMTAAEKQVVAEQAQILLRDLYVHTEQKNHFYGVSPQANGPYYSHVDPVAAIADVVANLDSMTVKEMEEEIYKIFVNQRDLHLNYVFPEPFSKYMTFIPVTFARTTDHSNFDVTISSASASFFGRFYPGIQVPAVGDQVVGYNGLPIAEAVQQQLLTGQGANQYAGFVRALSQMTFYPQAIHLPPANDTVTLTLKPENGAEYTIELPWLVQWIQEAPAARTLRAAPPEQEKAGLKPEDLVQAKDLYQDLYNGFVRDNDLEPVSAFPSLPTGEPTLTWGLMERNGKSFGYLKIDSFSPDNGVDFALSEITRIVTKEFTETHGLVIDVRSNGGGNIIYADKLSQLFMANEAQVIEARLLNTDLNRQIFNESIFGPYSNPEWTQVINEVAGTDEVFTATAPFTYADQANELGQIYYKQVAVLTDAKSYSATDLFSCAMQDNGAALIYGEEPQTGAGGANVIEQGVFAQYVGAPFEALPYGHSMRVSWRQSVRFGMSNGALIEDHGCYANRDISKKTQDVIDGGVGQMNKILDTMSWSGGEYRSFIKDGGLSRELYVNDTDAELNVTIGETQYVQVKINGVLFQNLPVNVYWGTKDIAVDLTGLIPTGTAAKVDLYGTGGAGNVLWNKKYVVTPVSNKVALADGEVLNLNFETATSLAPITVVNQHTDPANGWNLYNPYMLVGFMPKYVENVDTDAVIFLDLTNKADAQLSFTMGGQIEEGWDFIEVYVTDNKNKVALFKTSGYMPFAQYNFDLSAFAGSDNVAVHFRFTSDSYFNLEGLLIPQIIVQ